MSGFEKLFGTINWTPPHWGRQLGRKRFAVGFLTTAVVVALISYGWQRYDNRIRPPELVATVSAPGVTPVAGGELRPLPLVLHFTVQSDPRTPTVEIESIANLELVGDVVSAGIRIDPAVDGEWRWISENELLFQPSTDWPAGQRYDVHYDDTIFAQNLLIRNHQLTFETPNFRQTLSELVFYQDPVDTSLRKVVATIAFSHPVDIGSLQENATFTMRASGATVDSDALPISYDMKFDEHRRTAYLHTKPIDIPVEESFMSLQLSPGVSAANGVSGSAEQIIQTVRIPDIESYFRVTSANAILARDADDNPVQTVTFEFTDRVDVQQLNQFVDAYLLPNVYRDESGRRLYWQSPREVTPAVLRVAKKVPLQLNPVENDRAALHSFAIDTTTHSTLYLRVRDGLTSEGEFVLARQYDTLVRIPAYPQESKIAQAGAILPLAGSHQLTFVSRGVSTLRVELGRLIESDINHLASQTGGDIQSPYFNNYQFDKDNLSERITRYIDVNAEHAGKAAYSSLDLSEFLPDGGYYFVTVQGWDRARKHVIGSSDQRFILATDIGLLVKQNVDSTQDVFVHSIETGAPIANASIVLLGKNGVPILTRQSSLAGHAKLPATNTFDREKTPTAFIVKHADDSVFMPYARHGRLLQYSRFDTDGDYFTGQAADKNVRAQLFTDRGIYRPGDTVNLGAIVKRDDWRSLGNVPLRLDVIDPRGQTASQHSFRLPGDGFSEQQFTSDVSSPTGNYSATLYIVENNNRRRAIGTESFKIEEFLPDRLRIRAEVSGQKPNGWIKPEQLSCDVQLNNLFGTPASERRIKGVMNLAPSSIQFHDYPSFAFDDPLRDQNAAIKTIQQDLVETITDVDGRATLPLDLGRYDKGIYRLSVHTEGFEEGGGRSVAATASVMMSPLDYLIGYKADSDLSFVRKDSNHQVQFLAVDSDANAIPLADLKLSVLEYRYVSTLVKQANGTFAYQSVRKEAVVSTSDLELEADGTSVTLATNRSGAFALQVRGSDGLIYSKVPYTISGDRNSAGNLERNAELQLNLHGGNYKAGDEIELEITAPYTGTGLITIERDQVFTHKWFRSDTTTSVQTIRIPEALEGNAYVNVAFIRELSSPEIYVSPLSYAVAPFSINRDARTVNVELTVPPKVQPGETLTIDYKTSQKSRVVIYAVDEGILQVARYKMPQPLAFFLRKMALQVSTFQMVDLILPEFDFKRLSSAPGGGDAAGLIGKNLNPFGRKTDAPVAFWSGIVDASTNLQSVSFAVPDYFNGQLTIMAVAVSDAALGRAEAHTLVRGPFVISPNVLTAAAPGDEFEVNVGIANNLDDTTSASDINVSVSPTEHLEVIGDTNTTISVLPGREGRVAFRIRAKEKLGAASLAFSATAGSVSSQLSSTLSVRPAVARTSSVITGVSDATTIDVPLPRQLFSNFAASSAAASRSPLIIADGLLHYLDVFPHACAEQIVSKVFPKIGFMDNGDYAVDEAAIVAQFDATLRKLRSRQTAEGGFRFWATSSEPAAFASVYILHFLSDATSLSLPVPRDVLQAGLGYLEQLAGSNYTTLADARLRAYAIYVLTRNGIVTTNALTHLHETLQRDFQDSWRSDLTAAYMAASYVLLKKESLAGQLLRRYTFGGGDEMASDFDTRLGRDAQYVYLVARHFPQQLALVDSDKIRRLIEPVMNNRYNTLSSAYTALALGEYTKAIFDKNSGADVGISTLTNGELEALVKSARFARASIANAADTVRINSSTDQATYYVVSQSGFDRQPPSDAVSKGLEIQREYLTLDGEPVVKATIGDDLIVRLRIRSTGPPRSNVAVVDLLPGAFEVDPQSVQRQQGGWRADAIDVREDRVVVYGNFVGRMTEIRYQVKVVSAGSFTAPAAFASSMYDRDVHARTAPGRLQVESY